MTRSLSHGCDRVACPHCGKPLTVVWELYREWDVVRDGDKVILTGEPSTFSGGTCEECREWVNPGDIEVS